MRTDNILPSWLPHRDDCVRPTASRPLWDGAKVLLVCTGNICRSPYGEARLRSEAAKKGIRISVASAGTAALSGKPADAQMQEIAEESGINLSQHRARQLNGRLLLDADVVLVCEPQHTAWILRESPESRRKVLALGCALPPGADAWIADPYGQEKEAYQQAAKHLDLAIKALLAAALETAQGTQR